MKRSGLRGVNFNRKRCCGSDKNSHVRRRSRIIMKEPLIRVKRRHVSIAA